MVVVFGYLVWGVLLPKIKFFMPDFLPRNYYICVGTFRRFVRLGT